MLLKGSLKVLAQNCGLWVLFFFFLIIHFIYLFVFPLSYAESLLLSAGFPWVWRAEVTLSLLCSGFSLAWLLLLQSTGSGAHRLQWLRHLGSIVAVPGAPGL